MSCKEAILAYQINIKEKALEDVRYELKILDDDNLRLQERNRQLKQEQVVLMDELMKATKELDKRDTQVTKDEVIAQMKDNWAMRARNAQTLEELNGSLVEKDQEIALQRRLVEYWKDYRDRGQHDHDKQIRLLEESVTDLQETFETMSGHMVNSLAKDKEEIEKNTLQVLDRHKYIATEKAIAKMDKYSRREVIDNDWLLREIEMHRRETMDLFKVAEKLEEENLRTLSELFQCQMEDLRVSRTFFMTQFLGADDVLDENSILEIDLAKLKFEETDFSVPFHEKDAQKKVRPKSAMQKAIEDKVFSLQSTVINREEDEEEKYYEEEDEDGRIDFDGISRPEGSDDGDPFAEYLHLDDDDFDDYLRLGPLELKLLNVTGEKLSLHKPSSPSVDELRAKLFRPDEWPVTRPMLMDVLAMTSTPDNNPVPAATPAVSLSK